MGVKFLSQEWAEQISAALNSSAEFRSAATSKGMGLQQVVKDAPEGEIRYYFALENGDASIALGELTNPDATVEQSYETAVAMSRGEIGASQAFMQGKLKISGNMMKLMQLQDVLGAMPAAVESVPVDY
ncbi:MAG TPA: SCP2 sterol-binding domain-containing protein [Actinomycetota bacterium]|nr:SCP2 sterol-binding domain-containing protein [Actinomycetota bacterium]